MKYMSNCSSNIVVRLVYSVRVAGCGIYHYCGVLSTKCAVMCVVQQEPFRKYVCLLYISIQ